MEQTKLHHVVAKDASIAGKTSKCIQVDFLVLAKSRLAIRTVQRRGRKHDYMEQWGFRWIDAKEAANPSLVRGAVYDPENQEWDDNSIPVSPNAGHPLSHKRVM